MTEALRATDARHVTDATVVAADLSKWFGQKVAVSEVDCSFGPGVTGLLGPNGAGKTTLLRVLAGLLSPSAGQATILGRSPRKHHDVYRHIGFVPEDEAVYSHMSARRFVEWSAAMSKVKDATAAARRALETVQLTGDANRALSTFSKGMRQRAKVAAALTHDPAVLLLDEPLNGTDPIQRARLIELLVKLGREGRTIIVSSHVLAEMERMAGRVLAMVDGRVAAAGSVAALRDAMSDTPRLIRIDTDRPRPLAPAAARWKLGGRSTRGRHRCRDQNDRRPFPGPRHRGCRPPKRRHDHRRIPGGRVLGQRFPLPGGPSMSTFLLIVGATMGRLMARRRSIGMFLITGSLAPILLLLALGRPVDRVAELYNDITVALGMGILYPVAALVVSTAALGEERKAHTLPFLLLKPVSRWVIASGVLVAAALTSFVILEAGVLVTWLVAGVMSGDWSIGIATTVAVAVQSLASAALFVPLGLILNRATLAGLGYLFIWEGILGAIVSGIQGSSGIPHRSLGMGRPGLHDH